MGAEPEEGAAAESAEARDLLKKRERLVEAAEKEVEKTRHAAESAEAKLQKAMDQPPAERDEETIKALTAERDKAREAAEKASRRAAKALAKADQAREAVEIGDHDSSSKPDEQED